MRRGPPAEVVLPPLRHTGLWTCSRQHLTGYGAAQGITDFEYPTQQPAAHTHGCSTDTCGGGSWLATLAAAELQRLPAASAARSNSVHLYIARIDCACSTVRRHCPGRGALEWRPNNALASSSRGHLHRHGPPAIQDPLLSHLRVACSGFGPAQGCLPQVDRPPQPPCGFCCSRLQVSAQLYLTACWFRPAGARCQAGRGMPRRLAPAPPAPAQCRPHVPMPPRPSRVVLPHVHHCLQGHWPRHQHCRPAASCHTWRLQAPSPLPAETLRALAAGRLSSLLWLGPSWRPWQLLCCTATSAVGEQKRGARVREPYAHGDRWIGWLVSAWVGWWVG